MKILHSADWHLGVKNIKLSPSQQQLMKDEMLMGVQDLFRTAKREKFDVILICGDLFHSKNITQKMLSLFFKEVENFSAPVLFIEGNHDQNFNLLESAPDNLIVLNNSRHKFEYNGVNFYSTVTNADEIDNNATNILLLHGHIENSSDNDFLNINDYLIYPFDYIALGHVHQFKKYKKGENIFAYSGCLFSNGFDECGDKGYLEVVIENKKVENIKFVPFAKRRYIICSCDITGLNDNLELIKSIEDNLDSQNVSYKDLLRVILRGTYEEDFEKSVEIIKEHFSKYFYFEVVDESRMKLNIEKIKNEKLSFKYEFISLVENSMLDEEDKQKICEIGLEALKGEGLNL